MSTLAYEIVDVFTDRPFTGNPLAVVFGAEGLATEQLQTLAQEFNLAETVFVLPPTTDDATYRARIFTPVQELPFAGHPSVGAAVTASRLGRIAQPDGGRVIQECGAGLLPIDVSQGRATLTGGTPSIGPELDPAVPLAVAGLTADDLARPAPREAGFGLEFSYLAVRPDAVARVSASAAEAARFDVGVICVFSWNGEERAAHSRVFSFAPLVEDAATGSAALGLGGWLVASGLLPGDGESAYDVRQGVEMGRPSALACTVTASAGRPLSATVSGQVVPIATGTITTPPFIG